MSTYYFGPIWTKILQSNEIPNFSTSKSQNWLFDIFILLTTISTTIWWKFFFSNQTDSHYLLPTKQNNSNSCHFWWKPNAKWMDWKVKRHLRCKMKYPNWIAAFFITWALCVVTERENYYWLFGLLRIDLTKQRTFKWIFTIFNQNSSIFCKSIHTTLATVNKSKK